MTYRSIPLTLTSLLLLSCDTDDDLLSTADERTLGTDPKLADSDGDGLLDGHEEHFHLTDPTNPDSDGDGSDDGWEVSVGLDPLDPRSRRYEAGWPHLDAATKKELQREDAPSVIELGKRIRNVKLYDQNGQRVELYDFARAGTPTIVAAVGSRWLGELLSWAERPRDNFTQPGGPTDPALGEAVRAGELRLVLVASEGSGFQGETTIEDVGAALIGSTLGSHTVHLGDDGYAVWGHFNRPSLNVDDPNDRSFYALRFAVLDEDMIVRGIDDWQVASEMLQP